jgi:4-azaleucine resistance transporter AzlC
MAGKRKALAALKAAFPYTIPIFAGFWFLGLTYGIYMHALGFSWIYPTIMAATIFGGSLEFVIAGMLASPFAPLAVLSVTLAVQARHIFYGIAMLKRYEGTGWMRPYLIFGMCDETFSILASKEPPQSIDRSWFMFWVTFLDHMYWVTGAALGGLAGDIVPFSTEGLSFAMTALFITILLDQVQKETDHVPTLIGVVASIAALTLFGAGSFMLLALLMIVAALMLRQKRQERAAETADAEPGMTFSAEQEGGR